MPYCDPLPQAQVKSASDLNGAADDSPTVVNLQEILKQLILLFLILVESSVLQVDEFTHSAAEIHHGVPGVPPLQGFIASSQPGRARRIILELKAKYFPSLCVKTQTKTVY